MASNEPEDQAPAELGGWRLVELLGRGGMGEVWRAERGGPGGVKRRGALKRILTRLRHDGELVQRFMAEARISSRLEHPNIVSVTDFGDAPEPYLVFEFVEGISAADLLVEASRARVKLPAVVAAFVCAEVATGLDYAHRKRDEQGRPLEIVHRDVSPHNVLLSVEGSVKVTDFGVARAADNTLRTRAGVQVGKLVYMAPEQAAGDPIDARADVFALGIVLWELLTLQPLFPRDDAATTLKRLASGDIAPPSSVESRIPAALDQIVMTALSVDRERRFASAGAFAQALRSFVHSLAPGFDSGELIRILNKIAPSIAWHVQTPPPTDAVRPNTPQAPRPAAAAVAMPAVAMPMPAPAPAPPPQAPAPPPHAPMAAPAPPPATASAQPAGTPLIVSPSPSGASWKAATAPPVVPQKSMLPWIIVGVLVSVAAIAAPIVYFTVGRDRAPRAADESPATPPLPVQTPGANQLPVTPPQSTNSLTDPTPVADAAPQGPLPSTPTTAALDGGALAPSEAPSSPNTARAIGAVQRSLSQHEADFRSCIQAPSGTRARISLRVQWDGSERVVRFVESSSSEMQLALDVQQCLKSAAQRALAQSAVVATVTVRWSFYVETRSVIGFESAR